MELALLAAALLLAFANGANDNIKGVATLYGSGSLAYREALALAMLTTAAGSIASVAIASELVRAFSGKDLVPPEVLTPVLLTSVASAAAVTVLLATRIGMPISTTHAIVGGLLGAGAVLAGPSLNAGALGIAFLLPLALGPLLAVVLAWLLSRGGGALGRKLGLDADSCVCVERDVSAIDASGTAAGLALRLDVRHREGCLGRNSGRVMGVDVASTIEVGHWLSASAVGFARGLNDTPKILGLLVGASVVEPV